MIIADIVKLATEQFEQKMLEFGKKLNIQQLTAELADLNRTEQTSRPAIRMRWLVASLFMEIPVKVRTDLKHCLDCLIDLKTYNDMTDQSPYVILNEQQYKAVRKKWKRYQQQKRRWLNRDVQNNTLTTFERHLRRAEIEPEDTLSLHTLRKSCITNLANNITNPEVVRVLAGHAELKTTMQYYCQVDKEQKAKAAAVIGDLLNETDAKVTPRSNFG